MRLLSIPRCAVCGRWLLCWRRRLTVTLARWGQPAAFVEAHPRCVRRVGLDGCGAGDGSAEALALAAHLAGRGWMLERAWLRS